MLQTALSSLTAVAARHALPSSATRAFAACCSLLPPSSSATAQPPLQLPQLLQQQQAPLQLLRSVQPQQQRQQPLAARHFSGSSSSAAAEAQQPAGSDASATVPVLAAPERAAGSEQQLDKLLQVLLHPMPHTARWNAQLSPYLLQVNDQLLLQPSAVLLSVVRALHVIRSVLQEDGQIYVVESSRVLRPLIKTAAAACVNPNVWFCGRTWSPGMLTNHASNRRLFKESHQPNRRLFAARGMRPVNPLCPSPPPVAAPLPRLSWDDKWLLHNRTRRPGFRALLNELLAAEDRLYRFKPAGSLRGRPRDLRLLVVLDSSRNGVALAEAAARNVPTVALATTGRDMSQVTYPVLARDFSPNFVHWFLGWIVRVANVAPLEPGAGGGGAGRAPAS